MQKTIALVKKRGQLLENCAKRGGMLKGNKE
jgi:hypothetical protein